VTWADVDAHAVAIGALVARLHRALASPSDVLPSPVGEADADRIAVWRSTAEATLETASALTDGPEGERLRAIAPAALAALGALDGVARTPVMRIHGDLHVGQILRSPDGILRVNDFDGNPLAPVGSRVEPQAPARDVAWMLAAIDHVGRVVARRHHDAGDAIAVWIESARDAFLAAYRDGLGDRRELLDDRLLDPFAVAQEAHEFVYAARYQPRWRSVPDAALPAVLARSSRQPFDRPDGRSIR
jgi:maltokinase